MSNDFYNLVEELSSLWLLWMNNHNTSNNKKESLATRRAAGEQCEKLQYRRQEIIQEINSIFNNRL